MRRTVINFYLRIFKVHNRLVKQTLQYRLYTVINIPGVFLPRQISVQKEQWFHSNFSSLIKLGMSEQNYLTMIRKRQGQQPGVSQAIVFNALISLHDSNPAYVIPLKFQLTRLGPIL